MQLERVDSDALLHIARNMREWDKKEIYSLTYFDDPESLVKEMTVIDSFSWIGAVDDDPVAGIGGIPCWPHVWRVWMFATDRFPEIGLPMTKFVKRVMIPTLKDYGVHRAECYSIDGHTVAHKWLESLGAVREATLKQYGKNRETFHIYAWVI